MIFKFRRLLLRFERLSHLHYAFKTLAYTMINLRHYCRSRWRRRYSRPAQRAAISLVHTMPKHTGDDANHLIDHVVVPHPSGFATPFSRISVFPITNPQPVEQ
jgi:hypothetical protein